jgi:ankyrin repeat protein
LVVFL